MIVYGIFDPDTGELRYVGRSRDLATRLQGHKAARTPVGRWLRSLGQEPIAKVLAEPVSLCDEPDPDEWLVNFTRERAWTELERLVIEQYWREPLFNERGHGPSKPTLCKLCRKPGHDRRFCPRVSRVGMTCNDGPLGAA